jgi:hypothetical protein
MRYDRARLSLDLHATYTWLRHLRTVGGHRPDMYMPRCLVTTRDRQFALQAA